MLPLYPNLITAFVGSLRFVRVARIQCGMELAPSTVVIVAVPLHVEIYNNIIMLLGGGITMVARPGELSSEWSITCSTPAGLVVLH